MSISLLHGSLLCFSDFAALGHEYSGSRCGATGEIINAAMRVEGCTVGSDDPHRDNKSAQMFFSPYLWDTLQQYIASFNDHLSILLRVSFAIPGLTDRELYICIPDFCYR